MSILHQPTPTQRQAAERHRAFHASIAARAAERLSPPVTQELPPQAFPAEPDPPKVVAPMMIWPVIPDEPTPDIAPKLTIRRIQIIVAAHFGMRASDIISERRTQDVVHPRHVAMFLAKVLTQKSLPEIGRRFGGRDHTTALHAVRKIGCLMQADADLAADISMLSEAIMEDGACPQKA
jgi:hypothetical protein